MCQLKLLMFQLVLFGKRDRKQSWLVVFYTYTFDKTTNTGWVRLISFWQCVICSRYLVLRIPNFAYVVFLINIFQWSGSVLLGHNCFGFLLESQLIAFVSLFIIDFNLHVILDITNHRYCSTVNFDRYIKYIKYRHQHDLDHTHCLSIYISQYCAEENL